MKKRRYTYCVIKMKWPGQDTSISQPTGHYYVVSVHVFEKYEGIHKQIVKLIKEFDVLIEANQFKDAMNLL